jgi:fatty acid desaturase
MVKEAGLLRRRPVYYSLKIGLNLVLLATGWAAFAVLGRSWWQMLVAVFLAVMFTQTGFIGHDAGHRQIFGSKRAAGLIGRIHGNLLIGLSYGWWVAKHNRHHAHPNQIGRDPDIGGRAIAFTPGQIQARRRVGAWLGRYQAWLFFPMLLLEGFHLHIASVRALLSHSGKARWAEAGLLTVHIGGYLTAVFVVLSPLQAVVFLVVQQGLFGVYLGSSFAPNHKGMPVVGQDEKVDFLRRQVLTSRNIRGSVLTDLALGGLNYQIEHHLFPSMPRPNLRHAQAPVRAFCAQRGIPYSQTSLLASYAQVLRHLHTTGQAAGPEPAADTAAADQDAARDRVTQKTPGGPRRGQAILVTMTPDRAGPRRHLATSPFSAPDPEQPAEAFAMGDKVTHDKYGLGTVTGVEEGTALIIDFGSHVQRILTPSAKLSKL